MGSQEQGSASAVLPQASQEGAEVCEGSPARQSQKDAQATAAAGNAPPGSGTTRANIFADTVPAEPSDAEIASMERGLVLEPRALGMDAWRGLVTDDGAREGGRGNT